MQPSLIRALFVLVAAGLLAAYDGPNPTGFGGIAILAICYARRSEEIGGWLLLFHIQNYTSILVSIPLLIMNIESYYPSSWGGETGLYLLFVVSAVPGLLMMPVQLVLAERLRVTRRKPRAPGETPEQKLRTLRHVLYASLGFAVLALAVDVTSFPENIPLSVMALVPTLVWALYFQLSKRVQRVYVMRDWGVDGSGPSGDEHLDMVPPEHAAGAQDGAPVGVPIARS